MSSPLYPFELSCRGQLARDATGVFMKASKSAFTRSSDVEFQPAAIFARANQLGRIVPPGPELTAVLADCEICHGREMWAQQRLSRGAWDAKLTKMIKFGSPLPKSQQESVAIYLAKYLGPTVPRIGSQPAASAPPRRAIGTIAVKSQQLRLECHFKSNRQGPENVGTVLRLAYASIDEISNFVRPF